MFKKLCNIIIPHHPNLQQLVLMNFKFQLFYKSTIQYALIMLCCNNYNNRAVFYKYFSALHLIILLNVYMLLSIAVSQTTTTSNNETFSRAEITAKIPAVISLEIQASEVVFDLTSEKLTSDDMACVYGNGKDVIHNPFNLTGEVEYLPQGTSYHLVENGKLPKIVVKGNGRVENFLSASRNNQGDFICYKYFTLKTFSNLGEWKLTVERIDPDNISSIGNLYIQDSNCKDKLNIKQGLFKLENKKSLSLFVDKTRLRGYCQHIIVLAISPKGLYYGTKNTKIVYTLLAPEITLIP